VLLGFINSPLPVIYRKTIPIPIHDNRDEAATHANYELDTAVNSMFYTEQVHPC
jgi:hypothetical protein